MRELLDQEKRIDQEIAEELEKYRMEIEIGGLEEESDSDLRLPEGIGSEDYEISERQIMQMQIPASSNRDTSMISASGASSGQSSQQHNMGQAAAAGIVAGQSSSANNHPVRQRSSISSSLRR